MKNETIKNKTAGYGPENEYGKTVYSLDRNLEGFFNNFPSHYETITNRFELLLKSYDDKLEDRGRRAELVQRKTFPRYLNQKEVIAYLGHEKIFSILVDEYGLSPIRQEHKCNIYCSKQVEEKCLQLEFNIAA